MTTRKSSCMRVYLGEQACPKHNTDKNANLFVSLYSCKGIFVIALAECFNRERAILPRCVAIEETENYPRFLFVNEKETKFALKFI